ncbi:MAG: DUF2510 domain-containing protein [Actinomycetota bacterium]|jgi:hypothetical protein|nr:DUF2510 domain-containing protein [Actinomycetota bacterium]MDA3014490.1 DUF2510 domain-containing protein [Actinomycetota bacterium]MDA3028149.1 DUF2510 domain-containing protein [Actinomycetota bacterium]
MLEYTSISVSSYQASTLTPLLDSHSGDGWTVVAIVPTGTEIVAFLSRPRADGGASVADPAPAVETSATQTKPEASSAGWALQPEPASSSTPAATPAPAPTPAPASAAAAPAGWYADPSGRFELRYWDGGRWTEHVSRRGQQFTDPPVA